MKLIDADKFLAEASKQLDMQDLYLPVHIKDMVIDEMPTVEAIPVEWLFNHIPNDEVMHSYNEKLIEYLVIWWREENEIDRC